MNLEKNSKCYGPLKGFSSSSQVMSLTLVPCLGHVEALFEGHVELLVGERELGAYILKKW